MTSLLKFSLTSFVLLLLMGHVSAAMEMAAGEAAPIADDDAGDGKKGKDNRPSDAEYVAQLQRTIASDRKQLAQLKEQNDDPQNEFHKAQAEFNRLDAQWDEREKQIAAFRQVGQVDKAAKLQADSEFLELEWQAAKDRFDLAIQERKTLQEKVGTLAEKNQRDVEALDSLTGGNSHPHPAKTDHAPAGTPPAKTPPAADSAAPVQPLLNSSNLGPSLPTLFNPQAGAPSFPTSIGSAAGPSAPAPNTIDTVTSEELELARQEARDREEEAEQAEHKVESVNERFETLKKNIAVEEHLLALARARSDQAQSARTLLDTELQKRMSEDPSSLAELWERIADADKRLLDVRAETRTTHDRLDDLRVQLQQLQDEQLAALREAKRMHDAANEAEDKVARLENPFTPHNLMQWSMNHGPKLLAILVCTLLLQLLMKLSGRHIVRFMAKSGSRGTQRERENRALTLVTVFRNTASVVVLCGGTLMTFDEMGIPVLPLMGGAAVFGLAVAFGAQNLIRDYFSGFMLLLEDQYGINDVVKIGETSGTVEKITLRMTMLRDLEGAAHFLPHGNITRVTNMTHGWSRAVVDVGVAYKEDPDYVMDVLLEVANGLRKDPVFSPFILDDPEMLGVDSFGESDVVIKFVLKTHPLKRWPVRRELLRRIKRRFDELGIQIPFPHRTVYTMPASDSPAQAETPRDRDDLRQSLARKSA